MCFYQRLLYNRENWKMLWLTLFYFLVSSFVNADMDFTYSASDLYRLVQTEQQVSKKLQEIKHNLDTFSQLLEKYHSTNNGADPIIRNPILSYKLVKRHGIELKEFDKQFEAFTTKISDFRDSFLKLRSFTNPDEGDINYAMEAIIRLRQTYNLSVNELSNGQINDHQINGTLRAEDLYEIGKYAKQSKMNKNAKLFLAEALVRHKEEKATSAVHSDSHKAVWLRNSSHLLSGIDTKLEKMDREDFRVLTEMDAIFATDSLENLNKAFENLCQHHTVKEAPLSKLKCYLDTSSHPSRTISPLKIEVFHEDPQIIVIYDFINDAEIQEIESATFYKLKRSLTQVFQTNGKLDVEPSIIRTTSQAWIHDLGHPQFNYLSKRVESVTGYYLSQEESAEDLQVASYRPGGHYSLHTDALQEDLLKEFLQPAELKRGDRIATFMLYLSDVELGGNTVFPMLNVSVKPIKGSAILWGNLHPDGNIARYTLHGACPVIYGIKTIATKWIRANDQMFTRHRCKPDKSSAHFTLID